MNEHFQINAELVIDWMERSRREARALAEELRVSVTTVTRIRAGYVPKYRTVSKLAQLMGVQESHLLIPREAKVG